MAFTVRVTGVAGPSQLLPVSSVTNTEVTVATALLNPKAALEGFVPVVNKVVNPTSPYQRYVLPTMGVVMTGGVITSPTQMVAIAKVTAGATGVAFTVRVMAVAGPSQLEPFVSVTKTVLVFTAALLNPS